MSRPALTKKQKDINPNPAYWDHFDQWWKQDFSWDGLANHEIANHHDDRSLQDYWREEEGNLFPCGENGEEWTRFHLPPHDQAGNTTSKCGVTQQDWALKEWKDWRKTILSKLDQANEYTPSPLSPRKALWLTGCAAFGA
ncbi:MAG: hypothetical protein L3J04_07055 [Robiginitomaculum sp.]|nr:hypothetical protein [Robiginitomaculum sp.]